MHLKRILINSVQSFPNIYTMILSKINCCYKYGLKTGYKNFQKTVLYCLSYLLSSSVMRSFFEILRINFKQTL